MDAVFENLCGVKNCRSHRFLENLEKFNEIRLNSAELCLTYEMTSNLLKNRNSAAFTDNSAVFTDNSAAFTDNSYGDDVPQWYYCRSRLCHLRTSLQIWSCLQYNLRNASTKYESENLICKYNMVVK
jgi:hypothetical protein